jgi:hypothetical protein
LQIARLTSALLGALAVVTVGSASSAQLMGLQPAGGSVVYEDDSGMIVAADASGTQIFSSWSEYVASAFFDLHGKRCDARDTGTIFASAADCSDAFTNPKAEYDPSVVLYRIPVVVHAIQSSTGSGFVSDALIHSQIDILNEDFLALAGSLGAPGTNTQVEFYLATTDPSGAPTTGIKRYQNTTWFNDSGGYDSIIGWDPTRYLNIYLNTAGGNLGYAYIPSGGGVAGQYFDGVRVLWSAFGRNAPIGAPYNLGRSATHEVGHYLGLYHTFQGGCTNTSFCNQNGDLVCDTGSESSPNYSPCTRTTCDGIADPTRNYMNYSDDVCMNNFTPIQARRVRCTIEVFRASLVAGGGTPNAAPVVSIGSPLNGQTFPAGTSVSFSASANDPEDGDLSGLISWSSSLDGALGGGASISAGLSIGSHTVTASATDSGGRNGSAAIAVTIAAPPGSIQLSGTSFKSKGKAIVNLTWSGASGSTVDIYRNGTKLITTANDGFYQHQTGLKGSGSIQYTLCNAGSTDCSSTITVPYF